MRLTRNDHHRKLRAPIDNISDWPVNADVSDFCRPLFADVLGAKDSSTFRTSTVTCCLPWTPSLRPSLTTTQSLGDFQKKDTIRKSTCLP
jgi:hypothetical protein